MGLMFQSHNKDKTNNCDWVEARSILLDQLEEETVRQRRDWESGGTTGVRCCVEEKKENDDVCKRRALEQKRSS